MGSRKLAIVSAGLSNPSSTRMLADRLTSETIKELEMRSIKVEANSFELRDYAQDVTNNMLTGFASERLATMIDTVVKADALIMVTPIFSTSYSGLFKSFIDILEPDSIKGKTVLLGANAGTARHSLAIDYALRPLFAFLHADVVSNGVFAASSDWGDNPDEVAPLSRRIANAAKEFSEAIARKGKVETFDPFSPESYLGEGKSFGHLLGGFAPD